MKAVKFETYASLRIRGAILDQIRKMDWIPRTIRQRQKKIDLAIKEIEAVKGRNATDIEIAESLGISEEEFGEWQSQIPYSSHNLFLPVSSIPASSHLYICYIILINTGFSDAIRRADMQYCHAYQPL